jgi:hypothetical protein
MERVWENQRRIYPRQEIEMQRNPPGRPRIDYDLRQAARAHTEEAIRTLVKVMRWSGSDPRSLIMAANALLDRGWGKPAQAITGVDGEDGVTVTIRHLFDRELEREEPTVIDNEPEPEQRKSGLRFLVPSDDDQ